MFPETHVVDPADLHDRDRLEAGVLAALDDSQGRQAERLAELALLEGLVLGACLMNGQETMLSAIRYRVAQKFPTFSQEDLSAVVLRLVRDGMVVAHGRGLPVPNKLSRNTTDVSLVRTLELP